MVVVTVLLDTLYNLARAYLRLVGEGILLVFLFVEHHVSCCKHVLGIDSQMS